MTSVPEPPVWTGFVNECVPAGSPEARARIARFIARERLPDIYPTPRPSGIYTGAEIHERLRADLEDVFGD